MSSSKINTTRQLKKSKTRKSSKTNSLHALSIASEVAPEHIKVRKHRLGIQKDVFRHNKHVKDPRVNFSNHEAFDQNKQKKRSSTRSFDELHLDEGSDSEGNEWRVGHVPTDDDSELDSDLAFGESDEERFNGFAFSRSVVKNQEKSYMDRKTSSIVDDSCSSDSQEGEDFGQEAVDLIKVLDDNTFATGSEIFQGFRSKEVSYRVQETENGHNDLSKEDITNASSSDDDEEEEEEEDDDDDDDDDDETGDPTKLVALQDLIRNISQTSETDRQTKMLSTEISGQDQSFNTSLKPEQKLTLEDLGLLTVEDPHIKKSLQILDSEGKKSIGKLEVPLEKRQQDRLNRNVAYGKSKEILSRWVDTVKYNRRAEHISFPLPDHGLASVKSNKELAPLCSSKPYNELEAAIQNILEESGLATVNRKDDEDHICEFEELEAKELSIDELKSRRNQLRMARELLFHEEARLKRIKKIKSKSFRKVHRKKREKILQVEHQKLKEDGIILEDDIDFRDRRRAEERMNSRHKNSKWARAMKESGRTVWDQDVKSKITEMAIRDEELRKRIEGKNIRREYQSSDESEDSQVENELVKGISKKQQNLENSESKLEDLIDEKIPGARLANMDFMRRAELARKKRNDAMVEQIKRDLVGEHSVEEDEGEEDQIGRKTFGHHNHTKLKKKKIDHFNEFEEPVDSNDEKVVNNVRKPEVKRKISAKSYPVEPNKSNNRKKVMISNVGPVVNPEDGAWSTSYQKDKGKTSVKSGRLEQQKKGLVITEELNLSMAEVITEQKRSCGSNDENLNSEDSDHDSAHSIQLTKQQELISRAFAGADVVGEFEKEKKTTIRDEDEKTIDLTLPGWGNWVGAGIGKREMKRNRNRFLSVSEGVQPKKRKDANLRHVIINERKSKKNSKYLASSLPHPFETRQQYEGSLRFPIGSNWTTNQTFNDAIKPRLLIKQGVISPMSKPLI